MTDAVSIDLYTDSWPRNDPRWHRVSAYVKRDGGDSSLSLASAALRVRDLVKFRDLDPIDGVNALGLLALIVSEVANEGTPSTLPATIADYAETIFPVGNLARVIVDGVVLVGEGA